MSAVESVIRFVMPGLVPGIHVDGRDKPGHDGLNRNGGEEIPVSTPVAACDGNALKQGEVVVEFNDTLYKIRRFDRRRGNHGASRPQR
jgi:hypothetical protein